MTHTAADVTDDLENKRSASLNFLFLLSPLLLVFLATTMTASPHVEYTFGIQNRNYVKLLTICDNLKTQELNLFKRF